MPEKTMPALDLSAEAAAEGPLAVSSLVPVKRPDVTPAQLVAAIPIIAEFGHAFGVYDLSAAQQNSLTHMVTYAVALIGGDAIIRFGRNLAQRA